ncbi:tRNA-specific adenosine deaminase 1 [Lasiodiplodia hormozganensis]|uniref:tRNA-specific adenosine deaminase 1 n=1 Tax=Lasiodiplodia hormozganensis TaxID=869390 RepID=A0AA39X1Q2_9PEZI|nr:tRNA-specific adenosine deaminase 1 [Lasiodiplodia hormozganensis]
MPPEPSDVQACVLGAFDRLPAKCKPRARDSHARETGMKCLPASKVPSAHGVVLHDWHAEILALRAFNRFLVDECAALVSSGARVSDFVRRRDADEISRSVPQPFAVRSDVEIHMYCSEAPCGDASMELTMDAQEDPTPWSLPANPTSAAPSEDVVLRGRGYFSELGVVRRKPAALLLDPRTAYLRTLILPESQHVPAATTRAFGSSGRMAPLCSETSQTWPHAYTFRPFEVQTVSHEFEWSRRSALPDQKLIPCNLSALYTPLRNEVIINGALQGRKQGDIKGASVVSRRAMWSTVADIGKSLNQDSTPEVAELVTAATTTTTTIIIITITTTITITIIIMNFLEVLDFGLVAVVAMFLVFGTLALVAPVKPSARFVNFLRALPSAALWVAFSSASAVLNFAWVQFLFPVFALTIWCFAHVLSYLWDTAMEYLRYTAEERCFRQFCALNNAAERRAALAQDALEHERLSQRNAVFPLSTELGGGPSSLAMGWYQTARFQVPPQFTGDGLPAAPPATPIVCRDALDTGSSNMVHQSGSPLNQQQRKQRTELAPISYTFEQLAAGVRGPLLPLPRPLRTRDDVDAWVRLAFPYSSVLNDLGGCLDDVARARYGVVEGRRY